MIRVLSVNGKWTKLERARQRKLNRKYRRYILNLAIFGICLAWLINS